MNLLPSIDNAYNMIIDEEIHCAIAHYQDIRAEAVAFATRVTTDKSGIICTICHKPGHASIGCVQVISFPD